MENRIKVAVLDLYEGVANQGMRCITDILNRYGYRNRLNLTVETFDVRLKNEIPSSEYDIFISSGGPGSPIDSEGTKWEKDYFNLINSIEDHNLRNTDKKKHVFFICHSFQLISRYYGIGEVCKRQSTAFGVFPVHKTVHGQFDPIFNGLPDPFYTVDSRDWQVIQPDYNKLEAMGATLLAIEKERPHVPLPRAVMAVRFTPEFIGTQFHPEADAQGMLQYLQNTDKKEHVIAHHGLEKYNDMVTQLNDPDKIMLTQSMILPTFLDIAVDALQEA